VDEHSNFLKSILQPERSLLKKKSLNSHCQSLLIVAGILLAFTIIMIFNNFNDDYSRKGTDPYLSETIIENSFMIHNTSIPQMISGSELITFYGANSANDDNASAINAALTSSSRVVVPEGSFRIQSAIRLRNGVTLEGTRGSSKIIIDDTFSKGPYFPANEFAIFNEHFSSNFNSETADTLTIRGITFVMKTTEAVIESILGLGNAKNVILEDCDFIIENTASVEGNNLDLYAACKGVTVRNCYFKNDTGARVGCSVQVRCLTEDPLNVNNETCDVLIESNTFDKNGNDEVVAVYGCNGQVRNVTVQNNVIRAYGQVPDIMVSAFTGESTATLKDVFITGNQITADDIIFTVILIGRANDSTRMLDTVQVAGNNIQAKDTNQGNTFIIFSNDIPNKTNILIDSNTIKNTSSNPITAAVFGPGTVSNNTIEGNFDVSINLATSAYGNTIINNQSGDAIENIPNIANNIILN